MKIDWRREAFHHVTAVTQKHICLWSLAHISGHRVCAGCETPDAHTCGREKQTYKLR